MGGNEGKRARSWSDADCDIEEAPKIGPLVMSAMLKTVALGDTVCDTGVAPKRRFRGVSGCPPKLHLSLGFRQCESF